MRHARNDAHRARARPTGFPSAGSANCRATATSCSGASRILSCRAWDSWLQACVAQSREHLGDAWLSTYLTSPVWRFFLSRGVIGASTFAGHRPAQRRSRGTLFPAHRARGIAGGPARHGRGDPWSRMAHEDRRAGLERAAKRRFRSRGIRRGVARQRRLPDAGRTALRRRAERGIPDREPSLARCRWSRSIASPRP